MDSRNFYYLQRVLESDLDEVETDVAVALKHARVDLGVFGVHSGGAVTQNAPPDLHVLVGGPALATDPDGERVAWATTQTVDCSQDHLGNSTAVVGAGNERWLSVIAEYDTTYADLVTDGNGTPVYTRVYDSYNLYVTMEAEAVIPTAARPALPTDGILLADVYLVNGTVQILNADIYTNRRQDYVRVAGTTIPDFVYGTPQEAIAALAAYVDGLSVGTGVAFAATQNWADASTLAAVTVSTAINEVIADLAATAGAARIGLAAHATAGGFCDVTAGTPQSGINEIADAVDGHIGGGAPAHADSAITSAAQAGTPESFAGGAVRDYLNALLGHVNDRTERATAEVVTNGWTFNNNATGATRQMESRNVFLGNYTRAQTVLGGSTPPGLDVNAHSHKIQSTLGWAHPWATSNTLTLGATVEALDVCVVHSNDSGGHPRNRRVAFLCNETGASTPTIIHIDPMSTGAAGGIVTFSLLAGLPAPVGVWAAESFCTDGTYFYVMFTDTTTFAHRIQAYDRAGAVKTGWGATGTLIAGAAFHPFVAPELLSHHDRICVATLNVAGTEAATIATANYWRNLASGNSISVFDASDGTLLTDGDGDAGSIAGLTASDCYPFGGLASDGTNLFLTYGEEGSTGGGVYSCTIANAAVGSGLTGMPLEHLAFRSQEIVNDGQVLWIPNWETPEVQCYSLATQKWRIKTTSANQLRFGCFTGLDVYLQDVESTVEALLAYRIPCCEYQPLATSGQTLASMVRNTAAFLTEDEVGIITHNEQGRMGFDGDAVWMILRNTASGTLSGYVRRLPRAALR